MSIYLLCLNRKVGLHRTASRSTIWTGYWIRGWFMSWLMEPNYWAHQRQETQQKVWSNVSLWQPEAEFSAGKISHTADRIRKRRCKRGGNKDQFSSRAEAASKFSFLLVSVRPSVSPVHSQMHAHTQSFPLPCVSFLSQSSSLMSLLSLSAFTLNPAPPPSSMWQLCWWWLCAHGASWLWGPRWLTWQLLMFRCSALLTQGPWSHTCTYAHTQIRAHTHTQHTYQDTCQTTKKRRKKKQQQQKDKTEAST